MHRFEEEDQEPVAVVRTLSDFALALTLVVLMLIGTRSSAGDKPVAESHAVTSQPGQRPSELDLLLVEGGKFTVNAEGGERAGGYAPGIAQEWIAAHPNAPATIVLRFSEKTLATDLHRALLELQSAFGTNLARIDTVPKL